MFFIFVLKLTILLIAYLTLSILAILCLVFFLDNIKSADSMGKYFIFDLKIKQSERPSTTETYCLDYWPLIDLASVPFCCAQLLQKVSVTEILEYRSRFKRFRGQNSTKINPYKKWKRKKSKMYFIFGGYFWPYYRF